MLKFDLVYFLKQNYLTVLVLIGIGILYFLLNKIFGNGKHDMPDDDEIDESITLRKPIEEKPKEKDKHITKKGYSEHTNSYIGEARHYGFIPKDGSNVRINDYSKKRLVMPKNKQKLDDKEQMYEEVFKKLDTNLNNVAKDLHLPNDIVDSDIKQFHKKGKFLDVKIDIVENKVEYANTILDRSEDVFYTEEIKEKETETNNTGITKHKCPHCGTDNLIDPLTKKYNCYYCLQEVRVK